MRFSKRIIAPLKALFSPTSRNSRWEQNSKIRTWRKCTSLALACKTPRQASRQWKCLHCRDLRLSPSLRVAVTRWKTRSVTLLLPTSAMILRAHCSLAEWTGCPSWYHQILHTLAAWSTCATSPQKRQAWWICSLNQSKWWTSASLSQISTIRISWWKVST